MTEYFFRTNSSETGVRLYLRGCPEPVHFVSAEDFEVIASENGVPSIDRIFNSFISSNGLEEEVNKDVKEIKKKGGRLVLNRDDRMKDWIEWPYMLVIRE